MHPRSLALPVVIALALTTAACGSDDEPEGEVPRNTPALTIPTQPTEAPARGETTEDTTTDTETTPGDALPGGTETPATPPAAPTQGAPDTGGQAPNAPAAPPADATGGAAPGDGDFQEFCRQNPGVQGC